MLYDGLGIFLEGFFHEHGYGQEYQPTGQANRVQGHTTGDFGSAWQTAIFPGFGEVGGKVLRAESKS